MNRPLRVALLALAASLVAVAVRFDFPLCPLASSFGIPCPGCGLTRATLALLHGDLRGALHLHPLVWLLAPLFVVAISAALVGALRAPGTPPSKSLVSWTGPRINVLATLVLLTTLGVWAARFKGYFGGPVPVTSLRDWLRR